jgi:hypothetical protein
MSLWRIQITMSDDPYSQEMLTAALAEQRVWALLRSQRDTEVTGDVIIELPRDDGLGALLSKLHMISPQVFVSKCGPGAVARHNAPAAIRRSGHAGRPVAKASTGGEAWPGP